jgi:hypothetical protein
MTWETNQMAMYEGYLMHYGVPNMKWGRRRWQNQDGSLTPEGKIHYSIGEGGNKRLEKEYRRDMKQLNKLVRNTDVELQKAIEAKYNKRADVSKKVGLASASVATTGLGGAEALKLVNSAKKKKASESADKLLNEAKESLSKTDNKVHDLWKSDTQAYDATGKWTGKGYSDETWKKINSAMKDMEEKDDALMGERRKIIDDFNKGAKKREKAADIGKKVGIAAAGVSAASFGYAGYSKARAHVAKKLQTDEGHEKAVKKAREQYNQMQKTFANTSYRAMVDQQLIASYKKEHPNTKLTDKEILKNLTA